jgi:hypothetical protein
MMNPIWGQNPVSMDDESIWGKPIHSVDDKSIKKWHESKNKKNTEN